MMLLTILGAIVALVSPPSAEQFYGEALHNTRLLTQPANATYTVDMHVTNATFLSKRDDQGHGSGAFQVGATTGKTDDSFPAAYRNSDGLTAFRTQDGQWATLTHPWMNPTMAGLSDWIRYGYGGRPAVAAQSAASPTPAPTSTPETIASVAAFAVAYYNVSDAGSGTCANGDPGHAVHLAARGAFQDHPLTGATIDLRTHRLCAVQIGFHQSGAFSASGVIDADLSERDKVLLITHEHMEFNVHAFAIQLKHIDVDMTYRDFSFPQTLDQAMFK